MRAVFYSFAGRTKHRGRFVRIRMSIDPRIFIWMKRSVFLYHLRQKYHIELTQQQVVYCVHPLGSGIGCFGHTLIIDVRSLVVSTQAPCAMNL